MVQILLQNMSRFMAKTATGTFLTIVYCLGSVLNVLDEDFKLAIASLSLNTAEGFWLDMWGFILGVDRNKDSESDVFYRERIKRTALESKSFNRRITEAVELYSTRTPSLREPRGGVLINSDYSTYICTPEVHIVLLQYNLGVIGDPIYAGFGYFGAGYFPAIGVSEHSEILNIEVKAMVQQLKMAGTKIVYDAFAQREG